MPLRGKILLMKESLQGKIWWSYLEEDLQELLLTSAKLSAKAAELGEGVHDFSFIVFPAAKAYEGFLKKLFLDMGFISRENYFGKRFRIGRALNPSLDKNFRTESVYDKVANYCGGKELAEKLWETWRLSRNLVFHWFPDEKNALTLKEAQNRNEMIIQAIDASFKECGQSLPLRDKIR